MQITENYSFLSDGHAGVFGFEPFLRVAPVPEPQLSSMWEHDRSNSYQFLSPWDPVTKHSMTGHHCGHSEIPRSVCL